MTSTKAQSLLISIKNNFKENEEIREKIQELINLFQDIQTNVKSLFTITRDEDNYFINGIKINERVFLDELTEYKIVDREEEIEDLLSVIRPNVKEDEKYIVDIDIEFLRSVEDDYVLSSILTNEYLAESTHYDKFNEQCQEILSANEKVEKE